MMKAERDIEVVFMHGKTGTGKTYHAKELAKSRGFDYYVSSAVAGYRKPHIQGLQMISDKFGVPVTELVFVGDEEKDRRTASNANCKFVHIQRNETSNGSISNMYEILDILM